LHSKLINISASTEWSFFTFTSTLVCLVAFIVGYCVTLCILIGGKIRFYTYLIGETFYMYWVCDAHCFIAFQWCIYDMFILNLPHTCKASTLFLIF